MECFHSKSRGSIFRESCMQYFQVHFRESRHNSHFLTVMSAFHMKTTAIVLELGFRTKSTCNHALKLFFPLPSCGSWGQKEWQRPSHIGRTCTSYGRRAPPGCGRWACPSSWRWRRTGHTWMSSHLWQRQVSVCKSHFQFIYCCASKHTVITRS